MSFSSRLWCVVPAAGHGARMGTALPKQYLSIDGRTVAEHTLSRLLAYARLRRVVVALAADDHWFSGLPLATDVRIQTCVGGKTRSDSVHQALEMLAGEANDDDFVLVHDIARPCLRLSDLAKLIDSASADPVGAILAMRAVDTVKRALPDGRIAETVDREQVWLAATPQMIRYGLLRDALASARRDGIAVTDEAQAVERLGHRPQLVECARDNIKVTRPEDLALAAFWLARQQEAALDAHEVWRDVGNSREGTVK